MSQYSSSYRPGGDLYRPGGRGGNGAPANQRAPARDHRDAHGPANGRHYQKTYQQSGYRHDLAYQSGGYLSYNQNGGHLSNYQNSGHLNNYQNSGHLNNYQNSGHLNNYQSGSHQNGSHLNSYSHGSHYNNYNPLQARQGQFRNQGFSRNTASARPLNEYHLAYSQMQAEHQLWMGALDPAWTDADVREIWSQVGENPSSVRVIRDKANVPQYAFVTFPSLEAVAHALQHNRAQIPGSVRQFKLNWASGGSHGDRLGSQAYNTRSKGAAGKPPADFSLFVGDLGPDVTEPMLFARFNQEYPALVKQVKVMMDINTGAPKGFGFVRFTNADVLQKAARDMTGVIIGLRPIRVGIANQSGQEPGGSSKKALEQGSQIKLAQFQPPMSAFTDPHNCTISLKGVTPNITRSELVAHFLPFGDIVFCRINYAQNMAYIRFLLRAAAERALVFMHGFEINGARLALRWSREKLISDAKIRFAVGDKDQPYVAAEKLPKIYGSPVEHVDFESLTAAEIAQLEFHEELVPLSVQQFDELCALKKAARQKYLDEAL